MAKTLKQLNAELKAEENGLDNIEADMLLTDTERAMKKNHVKQRIVKLKAAIGAEKSKPKR